MSGCRARVRGREDVWWRVQARPVQEGARVRAKSFGLCHGFPTSWALGFCFVGFFSSKSHEEP